MSGANLVTRIGVGLIRGYQVAVSPMLAPRCRYWPSCSEFAIEALRDHGLRRGAWLAVRRLCRCHPWAGGGFDPVPPPPFSDSSSSPSLADRHEPSDSYS